MSPEYFLDTDLMRLHAEEVQEAARASQRLCDEIRRIRQLGDPSFAQQCESLLEKAQGLADFYRAMAEVVRSTSDDGDETIIRIRNMLLDARFNSGNIIRIDPVD